MTRIRTCIGPMPLCIQVIHSITSQYLTGELSEYVHLTSFGIILVAIKRIADLIFKIILLAQIKHDSLPLKDPLFFRLAIRTLGSIDDSWDSPIG